MVALKKIESKHKQSVVEINENFKWTTISINEVFKNEKRLEASVYRLEERIIREKIINCKHPKENISRFVNATYPPRFKRQYVDSKNGLPFILPSQILEINPKPNKYIAGLNKSNISLLKAKKNDILITRSGTIGQISIVSSTLEDCILSDDIIRLEPKDEFYGYIYVALKSPEGQALLKANKYGSVINHIEPEHLNNISIPNPHPILKRKIHNLIKESYKLRDEANALNDEAKFILKSSLNVPSINDISYEIFANNVDLENFYTPISDIKNRLDASYHRPINKAIIESINEKNLLTSLNDKDYVKEVNLPGRFGRSYVDNTYGTPFIGGKQIFELNPSEKKYLSKSKHNSRLEKELLLHENMILITRSGTIGKVCLVPKHWEGWAASEHLIRVFPSSNKIAGYLYTWLSSEWALPLITRFTYGAVVDEIDDNHVRNIPLPILPSQQMEEINRLAINANDKLYKAFLKEQEALKLFDKEVINS